MKVTSVIPVFHVSDVDAAVQHYTEIFGFAVSFRMGSYVGIKVGSYEIHLTLAGDFQKTVGGGTVYIICDQVDACFLRLKERGARIVSTAADRVYGFRDFVVLDPEGNQITFGQDLE